MVIIQRASDPAPPPSTTVSNITLCSRTVASIVATGQNGGAMLSVHQLELHVVSVKSCSETNVSFYAYSIKFTHILQGFFLRCSGEDA